MLDLLSLIFSMMLRERISSTLEIMQYDDLDVEANMITTIKIKHKQDFEKNKPKDEGDFLNK